MQEDYEAAFTLSEQILKCEGDMLSKLNFQLTTPNALVFLKRFAKVAGILATPRTKTELLANYFVELTLQEYKMLKYLPSTIAAAATYLALKTMGSNPWVSVAPDQRALSSPSASIQTLPLVPRSLADSCCARLSLCRRRSCSSTRAIPRLPSCPACAT